MQIKSRRLTKTYWNWVWLKIVIISTLTYAKWIHRLSMNIQIKYRLMKPELVKRRCRMMSIILILKLNDWTNTAQSWTSLTRMISKIYKTDRIFRLKGTPLRWIICRLKRFNRIIKGSMASIWVPSVATSNSKLIMIWNVVFSCNNYDQWKSIYKFFQLAASLVSPTTAGLAALL